jgi:copper oxidase (laccase) domain-containing protein
MQDLLEIQFHKNLKLVSFDITNTYSNISVKDLLEIVEQMCSQNGLNKELRYEIMTFCTILTKQNYFQYRDLQYIQEDGPAMAAPASSIFS